jgi:hypothetical protein
MASVGGVEELSSFAFPEWGSAMGIDRLSGGTQRGAICAVFQISLQIL